jgi:hypothetical protein
MAFHLKLLGARPIRLRIEPGKVFTIGRANDADLCLEDKLISRRHCEIELRDGAVEVRDLGSRNGTCLNGERIQGSAAARPGDQIKVGSSFLLVESDTEGSEARLRKSASGEIPARPAAGAAARLSESGARRSESRDMPAPTPRPFPAAAPAAQAAPTPPPIPPIAAPLPSLPGYELLKEIGRGDTGRIYRAVHLVDRRDVAIKILDLAKGSSETAVKRFYREARALQRLDHPNIVKIFEADRANGLHYYAMELVDGVTLERRLRGGPIGAREALSIAIQVARALETAHAENVIHRDVSPSNILVSPGGIAKLSDFGFVKSGDEEGARSLTNLGEIVGDLLYSSPEQVRDPRDVDARTDLYALGATLFHAVVGRPPFQGANYLETLRKVISLPAPRIRDLVPTVPPKVDEIVARLLEKERSERYETATALVRALDDALLDACSPRPATAGAADQGAIGGGFSGTELVEIVQFLEFNRKEGVLVVSAPPLEGEMRFVGGEIVAAGAGQLDGETAVLALLGAPSGTFRFRATSPGDRPPDTGLRVKPSLAALDAMRGRDEKSRAR